LTRRVSLAAGEPALRLGPPGPNFSPIWPRPISPIWLPTNRLAACCRFTSTAVEWSQPGDRPPNRGRPFNTTADFL